MKKLKLFLWAAVLALAISVVSTTASAQEADTLTISGTFHMDALEGIVGDDLAGVYANDNEHTWTLTLHGVTNSYDYEEWVTEWDYSDVHITRVHATSFDFEFFGPDADILNQVVSSQLVRGGLGNEAFLELSNVFYTDVNAETQTWAWFDLAVLPGDPLNGVTFSARAYHSVFSEDEYGYPLVAPRLITAVHTEIIDFGSGIDGSLKSDHDFVSIGESELPVLPPTLSITDGSVREGNRGRTHLDLTVTLSRSVSDTVTVNYATANGTAIAKSDYNATSGTLTFQPGETQATISLLIKGDRTREPDEYFTVRLSNASGATIHDGAATATILNDD